MVLSASTVSLVSIAMTVLMVAARLYLVWGALGSDMHRPSPGDGDRPELDDAEDDETDDSSGELPEGSSA
jgi:hypothetical protein